MAEVGKHVRQANAEYVQRPSYPKDTFARDHNFSKPRAAVGLRFEGHIVRMNRESALLHDHSQIVVYGYSCKDIILL
jgi:hypothetical protein